MAIFYPPSSILNPWASFMGDMMNTLANRPIALPAPSANVNIRPGVMSDVPFIDQLQKMHAKQVGWMPLKQLEQKVERGHVLIAEEIEPRRHGGTENEFMSGSSSVSPCLRGESIGYIIGTDQYFKRDDVGIIYQLNVVPHKQRGFIGAALLPAA